MKCSGYRMTTVVLKSRSRINIRGCIFYTTINKTIPIKIIWAMCYIPRFFTAIVFVEIFSTLVTCIGLKPSVIVPRMCRWAGLLAIV